MRSVLCIFLLAGIVPQSLALEFSPFFESLLTPQISDIKVGARRYQDVLLYRDGAGHFWIEDESRELMRLKRKGAGHFSCETCQNLDAYGDLTNLGPLYELVVSPSDRLTQKLSGRRSRLGEIDLDGLSKLPVMGLQYRILHSSDSSDEWRGGADLLLGAGGWVMESSHNYDGRLWNRGNTFVQTENPKTNLRWRIGDLTTNPGRFGSSTRLLGLQVGNTRAIIPGYSNTPTYQLGSTADVPMQIELYRDNQLLQSYFVEEGPYQIEVPSGVGASDIQIVGRGDDGSPEILNVTLYGGQGLLKQGASEFSFDLGSQRISENDYQDWAATGYFAQGVKNDLTAYGRLELADRYAIAGAGLIHSGVYGIFGTSVLFGDDRGLWNHAWRAQYQKEVLSRDRYGFELNFNASVTRQDGLRRLGGSLYPESEALTLSMTGARLRASLSHISANTRESSVLRFGNLRSKISWSARFEKEHGYEGDWSATLLMNYRFTLGHNGYMQVRKEPAGWNQSYNYSSSWSPAVRSTLSYQNASSSGYERFNAYVRAHTPYGYAAVRADEDAVNSSVSGAVFWVGDQVSLGDRVSSNNAYAVVQSDERGVIGTVGGREVSLRGARSGVVAITPYTRNIVDMTGEHLPIGTRVDSFPALVSVRRGHGVIVPVKTKPPGFLLEIKGINVGDTFQVNGIYQPVFDYGAFLELPEGEHQFTFNQKQYSVQVPRITQWLPVMTWAPGESVVKPTNNL